MPLENKDTVGSKQQNLRGANEILHSLKESPQGIHCIMVYPDLFTLRAVYADYTKTLLENNEIVLFLPYYETADMVRYVLSGAYPNLKDRYSGINIGRYEKEGSFILKDSLMANSDDSKMNLTAFLEVLNKHVSRHRKSGITILLDIGSFYHNLYDHGIEHLHEFESTTGYENTKFFCLYNQRDFENRFNHQQQATLLEYHNRSILCYSNE